MKLLNFKFKNIFSLGVGEINLANRGLILVTGHSLDEGSSNGSGKSSIGNKGILWTIYGATAGGLKADDVVNRHGDTKSGWGSIDFIGVDGFTYTVTRSRPAKLELLKDGKDISSRKAVETQKLIDQAIGIDFKSFIQTYMFGQGRLNSYASLPPADQKAILEQILPIENLTILVEYVKKCLSDIKYQSGQAKIDMNSLERRMEYRQKDMKNTLKSHSNWETERETRLQLALRSLSNHKDIIKSRDEKIAHYLDRLAKLPECDKELKELNEKFIPFSDKVKELERKFQAVKDRKQEWNVTRRQHFDSIVSIDGKLCPKCGRDGMSVEVVERLVNENEEHNKNGEVALKYMEQCDMMMLAIESERSTILHEQQSMSTRKLQLDVLRQEETRIRIAASELNGLPDMTEELMKIAEAIPSERNPFNDTINGFHQDLEAWKSQLAPIVSKRNKLEEEITHVEWWLTIYGHDAKMKLFENVCFFLDSQVNKYLKDLKNPQLKVQFSTVKTLASGEVKEDFNVRVYSEKGGEGFETLSGGEQQIVSFAISKALSDLARAQTAGWSEFQILDEPFSMLDPRNCESLIEFLGKEQGTIMLISNDEHLMNLVPERLHVEKYKGVTTVAYGG